MAKNWTRNSQTLNVSIASLVGVVLVVGSTALAEVKKDEVSQDLNSLDNEHIVAPLNTEIVIESVLASVDDIPITLRELGDRLTPKRSVALSEFQQDPNLKQVLESMIQERLIEAEASSRKIKVSPDDIERYIGQVAAQNNLSKPEFENALSQQGKSLEEFRKQARLEVLRSRLMGQIAQSAPAVTNDEPRETDSPEDPDKRDSADDKVRYKLREIVLLKYEGQESGLSKKASKIYDRLESGEDFASLAKEVSQGATAENGGELGEVVEEDLSEEVRSELSDLSPGEFSPALDMPDAIRFFYLEKKFEEGESSDSKGEQREQIRKQMENRKLEARFEEFFTTELPKLHKVDRKV